MPIPGAVPASMGRRLLAAVIDAVAALVLGGGFVLAGTMQLLGTPATDRVGTPALLVVGWVVLLVVGAVQWWALGTRGWTLGKRLVGLRVVQVVTGRPIGAGRALARLLVQGASGVVPLVGPVLMGLSPLLDGSGRRQGWHDRVVGSLVLDVVVGRDPIVSPPPADATRRIDALLGSTGRPAGTPRRAPALAPHPPAPARALAPPAPALAPPAPASAPAPIPSPVPPAPVAAPAPGSAPATVPPPVPALELTSPPPAPVVDRTAPEDDVLGTTAPLGVISSVPLGRDPLPATQPPRAEPTPDLPDDVERTRLRPARARVPELAGDGPPSTTLALTDGRRVTLTGTALVGRDPAPRPGEQPEQLLRVADPARSVSKTHLAVGVDRTGVWVRDRSSTNGTVVTLADGQQILCGSGQQVRLPAGASVAFGDYGFTVVADDAV